MKTMTFQYAKESKQNPYIGFTSFQHFRTDPLYSDLVVRPENNMTETEHVECYPIPTYVEENGRAEGYYPDTSVAYIRVLWKEFEPNRGEYNFSFLEEILQKAAESRQTVMFRLMPHSTRESDDVPDWVKTIVDCPPRLQGQRIKTSPTDPKFLDLFGNAIRKIGERFDADPTLAFVDVSFPGAWGEGSSVELFSEEILKCYLDIYTQAFPHTALIGQISAPELTNYMNQNLPVGWRADCIGNPWQMENYVPQYSEPMKALWKTGHVSMESYWWLGEWKRKGWDLDSIIDATLSWHISTFNAKSLPIPREWQEKIDAWVAKMGYHFVIDQVTYPEAATVGASLSVQLTVTNVGVAPIYHRLPLRIRLKSKTAECIFTTDVDITKWIEGSYTETMTIDLPAALAHDTYTLQLGMGGEGTPTAVFATTAEQDGDWSVIGEIIIK